MKIKIINKLVLLFTILFISSAILVLPAGSFYTYCDDLKSEYFIKFWQGDNNSLSYITNDGSNAKLILDKNVFDASMMKKYK